MSIDHIKKQAKNLRRLLPAYLADHPDGAGSLADYQELIARTHGYPSFHALNSARSESAPSVSAVSLGALRADYEGKQPWTKYEADGNAVGTVEVPTFQLATSDDRFSDDDPLWKVTTEFDSACDQAGAISGDFSEFSPAVLKKLVSHAEQLCQKEPAFLDGVAFRTGAMVHEGRFEDARQLSEAVVEAVFEMLSASAKEHRVRKFYVPYLYLPNRPFHRLAHSLVLAYCGLNQPEKAQALCRRMLALWPNDNIGFRFIEQDPTLEFDD